MKILGIIPARGGSKGIPRKNLKKINGKSLLQYAIEAGQNSKYINRLIVSTEDEEIKNKSKELGCEVIERPGWLAKDETPTLEVIENILTLLNKINKYIPDYIVLIQPTAPLRESKHIDEGIDQLLTSEVDSVISVSEVPGHYNPNWLLQIENNVLSTIKGKDLGGLPNRRQDLDKYYYRNGAIYAFKTKTLKLFGNIYGKVCLPYKMEIEKSINIDSEIDLFLATKYFTK